MYWKCRLWERFFIDTKGSLIWISRYSELIQLQLKPRNPPLVFFALWDLIIFNIIKQLLYLQLFIILWDVSTLCVFFRNFHLIKGYVSAFLFVFRLRKVVSKLKVAFSALWDFPKKNRIIFQKERSFVIPVGETVVFEPYVYLLGYFLALRFELTLSLSANQWKETQANTKQIQSSINRLLKEIFFHNKKISNLIWIGSVFEEKNFKITAWWSFQNTISWISFTPTRSLQKFWSTFFRFSWKEWGLSCLWLVVWVHGIR